MSIFGVNITPHRFAQTVSDEYRIERHPTPKKRRGWRVVKHTVTKPGAYRVGNTIYAHPDVLDSITEFLIFGKTTV